MTQTKSHSREHTKPVIRSHRLCLFTSFACWIGVQPAAMAMDLSYSGFGTLGYARSNQPFVFQRFISDTGTLERDSIAGIQLDARFTNQIGATIQAKLAPSMNSDSAWEPALSWAFLSWRATNDLLIRFGKQRSPAYLFSETMDIGVTYDFARLPTEIYDLVSSNDYIGASLSNTWTAGRNEWVLDVYGGRMDNIYWRFYQRDHDPSTGTNNKAGSEAGAHFQPARYTGGGVILSLLRGASRYRIGWHHLNATVTTHDWRMPTNQTLVPASGLAPSALAPAIGGSVYTVLPQDYAKKTSNLAIILGANIQLPRQVRLIGEFAYREVQNVRTGVNTNSGYLALLKDIRKWTPYAYFAKIKSKLDMLDLYQVLNQGAGAVALAPIPEVIEATTAINASQRALADSLSVYDQQTIALGAAYRITPKQKFKLEWARTHIGVASSLVDAPPGGNVSHEDINVFSLSWNMVF